MTHTHEWDFYQDGTIAFCKECPAILHHRDIQARLNACAGVTLGEGASVKRLVEAVQELSYRLSINLDADTYMKYTKELWAALAPFVEE